MNEQPAFHIVTVGWPRILVEGLWDAIAAKSQFCFSHVMHPSYVLAEWPDLSRRSDIYFFRDHLHQRIPDSDPQFLASLEQADIPTIHNMIMGDRVVSKISYDDALRYATFLARRLIDLYSQVRPTLIIGGFDAIHSGIALAVAKYVNIPWFALNFSVIPPGLACFCDRLSPTARVHLRARSFGELRSFAEISLQKFESKSIRAPAYIAPRPLSLPRRLGQLPARFSALVRTIRSAQVRESLQFTEARARYSVPAALELLHHASMARKAIHRARTLAAPPSTPYVLFGLHFQPESSIDVWAPFFSNQMWVIELISRSIPPSHKLLVKIHKSDATHYSSAQLKRMCAFPGVELVRPFADTHSFIEKADLVISIQGTIGLEAALLGKPVIMLGDSPVKQFPNVSRIGEITDLPMLVRAKLSEAPPSRDEIVNAYAQYLSPFLSASHNDWTIKRTDEEIDGYVRLFNTLKQYVAAHPEKPLQAAL